jgi:hypothetical protein
MTSDPFADDSAVMHTNMIVGDIVQIILTEEGALASLGFEHQSLFLKIVGLDDLGLWVEHPLYKVVHVNDEDGMPLPEDEQVHKQVDANFLLRWEKIDTIVHFPNREGFDMPSPFEKQHIGFIVPSEEKGGGLREER